eukprot:gene26843-4446_t
MTSKTKIVKRTTANGDIIEVEVPVWNWVVANITLMAVGSSSPEILLAIIETIMALGKPKEELGASTIIGSSSFNLFVITAVCVVALKDGEYKRLDHIKVFCWTTAWMLWAHLWIWLVYNKVSPGQAFATLGFFPFFVQTSYLVDIRGFNWLTPKNEVWPVDEDDRNVKIEKKHQQMHSILYYRQQAVNQMKGGSTLGSIKDMPYNSTTNTRTSNSSRDAVMAFEVDQHASDDKTVAKIMFKSPQCSCLESAGAMRITQILFHCSRNQHATDDKTVAKVMFKSPHKPLSVQYKTEDDTAVAGLDYELVEGVLKFAANEEVKEVEVKLLDDEMGEPDVSFYLTITQAEDGAGSKVKRCLVNIVDDEAGGILSFELPSIEASMSGGKAEVMVIRRNGTESVVTVKYTTKEGSAAPGLDYEETTGRFRVLKSKYPAPARGIGSVVTVKCTTKEGSAAVRLDFE